MQEVLKNGFKEVSGEEMQEIDGGLADLYAWSIGLALAAGVILVVDLHNAGEEIGRDIYDAIWE